MMQPQKQKTFSAFDAVKARSDFPALGVVQRGRSLAFLDSAASAQKPRAVIDAMTAVMSEHYANVHRGVYLNSQKTTELFEEARQKIARFLHAESAKDIVFTRNATEAINLVAASWGRGHLQKGDEVILSALEHHANIVPWYLLKRDIGIELKIIPMQDDGSLDMEAYKAMLSPKTQMVAITHVSNALGSIVDVTEITRLAKAVGAAVLIDGSQAVTHLGVNVQDIGCDFYVFTGHKLYGPTGIGVLYGRASVLQSMPPYQGGGEMIEQVAFDHITFKDSPYRFEAGTPAFVEAIGLGAAIDYFSAFDIGAVVAHENDLLRQACDALSQVKGIKIFGTTETKAAILSFTIDGMHPHDIGTIFDQMGVAVRAGHHCAQPLMKRLGVPATVRASFALYNTADDVVRLAEAVDKAKSILG